MMMPNRIKELLDQKGKTPYWLHKQTKISTQTIYSLVTPTAPTIDDMRYRTVKAVADALGVEPEELKPKQQGEAS